MLWLVRCRVVRERDAANGKHMFRAMPRGILLRGRRLDTERRHTREPRRGTVRGRIEVLSAGGRSCNTC